MEKDPKENKNNDSDSESENSQDEIDTSTLCPYKKVTNFFSGMFSSKPSWHPKIPENIKTLAEQRFQAKQEKNYALADKIIRNTYKTLLSRGQKGCYIYCEDKELLKHMSDMLKIEIIK